jgi:hypothetical protein
MTLFIIRDNIGGELHRPNVAVSLIHLAASTNLLCYVQFYRCLMLMWWLKRDDEKIASWINCADMYVPGGNGRTVRIKILANIAVATYPRCTSVRWKSTN